MGPAAKGSVARAAVHAALGLLIVIALNLFARSFAVGAMAGGAAVFLLLELLRLRQPRVKRWLHARLGLFIRREEDNKLTGASYFLLGSLVTAAAFPLDIASLAIVYLALGDSAAAVAGISRGRTRLWTKYAEGDLAFLVVSVAVGVLAARVIGAPPLAVAVAGGMSATLFHAIPAWVNDNLTIPVGSALAMAIAASVLAA